MYYGNKRLDYTRIHQDRWAMPNWRTSFDNIVHARRRSPEGFADAIYKWLDENLPEVIKRGINFRIGDGDSIDLCINKDYCAGRTTERGRLSFEVDHVRVSSGDYSTLWETKIDYADPNMFEHLRLALTRFYNGQTK